MTKENDFYTFKMLNERKPVSWGLGLKQLMLVKTDEKTGKNMGRKYVQYVPGEDSIFKEDHTDDKKPAIPTFEYGILKVNKNDKALFKILMAHPHKGVHYDLLDKDKEAKDELELQENIKKAFRKVDLYQDDEIIATGVVLFGRKVLTWSVPRIKVKLQRTAIDEPIKIINEIGTPDFNAKYVAALSIMKGVIKENATKTAIVWGNNNKTIINVAVGQSGVVKLGEFLSQNTKEAKNTLQEIGEQLKKPRHQRIEDDGSEKIKGLMGTQEEEVNDQNLSNSEFIQKPEPQVPPQTETKQEDLSNTVAPVETQKEEAKLYDLNVEQLRDKYESLFEKDVPVNMKNNTEWLKGKIEDFKE